MDRYTVQVGGFTDEHVGGLVGGLKDRHVDGLIDGH